jgi:amino acid transporter
MILLGTGGAVVLTLGAVFSITGNLTASMLSAPRMLYAMAHIGSLPAWFGAVHPRFQTPANAIGAYTLFSIALALTGGFVWLAAISTAVRMLVYVMCIVALPRLEHRIGEVEGQFRLPGGLAIPGLALVLSLWLMTYAPLESWGLTAAFMVLGAIVYALVRRRP